MTTHESILSKKKSDIKDVPPLPEGSFLAVIASTPKIGNFGQKSTPGVEFQFRLKSALEDVDAEQLAAAGGIPALPLTYTFWDTPKAAPMLRNFIYETLAMDENSLIGDLLPETPGMECIVTIEHQKNQKKPGAAPFPRINGFAAAPQ